MANNLTVSRRQQRVQSRIQPLRSTRLTVYMTESEADELDKAAQNRGTPLSAFLRYLIERGIDDSSGETAAMTGSNAIIAIVVGAIVVIVGFSLWPVLNASSNNLYSAISETSCDDGSGNRFLRGYVEHTGANPASITKTALSGGNWGLYEGYDAQSLPSDHRRGFHV